jgi:integrase
MRLYKRGNTWWCSFYEGSERQQRSTRCADKKAAETVAREFERAAADPASAAQNQATFADAMSSFLAHRTERAQRGDGSLATVTHYRAKLGHATRLLDGAKLNAIDATVLDQYVTTRRSEGASDHTIAKEIAAIRGTLTLAKRRGLYKHDPRVTVPHVAAKYVPKTRALTVGEVQQLIAELQPDRAAQVAWMVAVAGDWSAVARARRDDCANDYTTCRVRGSKRATRDRVVPVVLPECRALLAFAMEQGGGVGEFWFRDWQTVHRDMKAACVRAGIKPCSPNDLRRTHGQWLRSRGVQPHLIGEVLGHVDSTMAERVYARPSPAVLAELIARQCSAGVTDRMENSPTFGTSGQPHTHESPANPQLTECRRSELNQRPWDYDSYGLIKLTAAKPRTNGAKARSVAPASQRKGAA